MSQYWSELVRRLDPYVPGEQPRAQKLVKLNTNENPYPPSPRVMEAIAAVSESQLARYPDPESKQLREAFADRAGLSAEEVFVGNGSDEVLGHTFQALLKQSLPIRFPDISYSFYPVWCKLYGIEFETMPLSADFRIDPGAYVGDCGGIIVPNPNAPTGIGLSLDKVRQLLDGCTESAVVIDEAYVDFGAESATRLVRDYPNLLVVQTLSKSHSLAGLRVGAAFGQRPLIEALERVKNSFNSYPLDAVAQAAAMAALQDEAYLQSACARVVRNRDLLVDRLGVMGFDVLPSVANFLFVHHPDHEAATLFKALRDRGVIVRYFDRPRISGHLRISVGSEEDCKALLEALAEIV
ncbi:MAG: histidinol-phosphate transaminase [Pseudomonadota bacterium]